MDPTSLPTDNLYKFLALAGLAFAGFCAWLYWKLRESHFSNLEEGVEQAAALEARVRHTTLKAAQLKSDNQRLVQDIVAAKQKGNELPDKLLTAAAQMGDRLSAMHEEIRPISVETSTLKATSDSLGDRLNRHARLFYVLGLGVIVGISVSGSGFILWYLNVQWYADVQAKGDFEDHMAELAAKRVARDKAAHAKP